MDGLSDGTLTSEMVRSLLSGFSHGAGDGADCRNGRCDDGDGSGNGAGSAAAAAAHRTIGCRCDGPGGEGHDGSKDTADVTAGSGAACRRAAVMVVICGKDRPDVIMTIKHANLRMHAGEVSFPGGKVEDGDWDLLHTALRETQEEIGLDISRDRVVARLCNVMTRNSGFVISPFVAVLDDAGFGRDGTVAAAGNQTAIRSAAAAGFDAPADAAGGRDNHAVARGPGPVLTPNSEVEEILLLPLGPLLDTMSPDVDPSHLPTRGMHTFEYGDPCGRTIWGASARILAQIRDIVGMQGACGGI